MMNDVRNEIILSADADNMKSMKGDIGTIVCECTDKICNHISEFLVSFFGCQIIKS